MIDLIFRIVNPNRLWTSTRLILINDIKCISSYSISHDINKSCDLNILHINIEMITDEYEIAFEENS